MSGLEIGTVEAIGVWVVRLVAAVIVGFVLGYRLGWRDCIRKHERTVTRVEGSTVTIGKGTLAVGDRIWFRR